MRTSAAIALALLLSACATTSVAPTAVAPSPAAPTFVAIPGLKPAERVEEAVQRLRRGQVDQARAELAAALAAEPANKQALRLQSLIDADPRQLLGEQHYVYRVRPGETLWTLSQRLLDDPMLFYPLARYNGIANPSSVAEGAALMIPGAPKKVAVPSRRTTPKTSPAAAPVQSRAADPAQAGRLRRTALEHMNRGQVDKAEVLLRQANTLDPDSALIRNDLDRARRIQASLRPGS